MAKALDAIYVLDHGYVRLVDTWGSDERIIEAARMSTDKGFKGWGGEKQLRCLECQYTREPAGWGGEFMDCPNCHQMLTHETRPSGDEKLLRYLYTNGHMTPFEMGGLIVEVQAPIFVFREWHRHRTQSYNEMSARYVPLPDVNYVPTIERLMANSGSNKQAQGTGAVLREDQALTMQRFIERTYVGAQEAYDNLLRSGVPKELARLVLPVGRYSKMRASANLRNWLQFLTLRLDENAQWEIRQYAEAVGMLVAEKFPRTWELFKEGRG